MRTDITRQQIAAIVAMIEAEVGDDDQLLLDTLEGQTDLFEVTSRLLRQCEDDEGIVAALDQQMNARKDRKARANARIEARRNAIAALMETAGIDKLPLPEATVSFRKIEPKVIVIDPDSVPDEYCTFVRKPDLKLIREASPPPPGTGYDNGGNSITVRRK